uniref:Putative tick transposon n=1 Tax=Rhipicephalus microplus TaxID=6941 RepID=A0A6G5ABV7_RHIMP
MHGEAVVESNHSLLLSQGVCVARSLVDLHDDHCDVFVTNVSYEHRHLFSGTVIAYADPVANVTECFASEAIGTAEAPFRSVDINPTLSEANKQRLSELLLEFDTCFARSSKIRQTPITKHRIITYDDAHPIRQQAYHVSPTERHAIQTQVKEMLQDGVIQPSSSPWSSPVVLVKKKDGTLRFCVDYRKLNNVTKKDVYPLPRVDDSLDKLRRAKYFSSVDLKSGYWQIEVDERDREKTAFVTPDGLYEFKVLPFGLCSAPATFQRMMDTVLADLKWKSYLVYFDDVVVFLETFDEHLRRLRNVLEAIRSADLTLKPEK